MKLNNPELLRSQCLINGEWCDALSGKREAVINPATGAELASIPLVSEEETQQAIAAAQRAQNDWKQLTAKQRSALLLAWADKVLAAQEDLAQHRRVRWLAGADVEIARINDDRRSRHRTL